MNLYVICVCEERGIWLVFDANDPDGKRVCGSSPQHAIGKLVMKNPVCSISSVMCIEWKDFYND